MSELRNEKAHGVRLIAYLPEILVLIVCAVLLWSNISAKEGYHMDELLSFELANAEFNPWIVPTQPQGRLAKFVENELRGDTIGETMGNLFETVQDVLTNRGASKLLSYQADVYEEPVWIDRETFTDYITVGKEDGFSYLSVYFNVKDDNHPPLHFMVLHTVSSLFRGEIMPAMGCMINLVCVLGIMVLLMYLGRLLLRIWGLPEWGKWAGLWAAALYGFSVGAVSTTLLIRMYAMVTFWCVATLVLHVHKLYSYLLGGSDFTEKNKLLILVTVLGFWTQYFFLFYCLVLAAVTVVVLWKHKRREGMGCYIRAMILAAVIGVVTFPFAFSDVFASSRGVEALANLSAGLSGYGSRILTFIQILWTEVGWILALVPVVVVAAVVLWVRSGANRQRNGAGVLWVLWIPIAGYLLLASRMSPYLVNRYVMPLFPLVIVAVIAMVCKGFGVWGRRESNAAKARIAAVVCGILLTVVQLVGTVSEENGYLYQGYDEQKALAQQYEDYPCICVYQGVGYYENLIEFTAYDKTLLVTPKELENRQEVESVASLSKAVVLVKGGRDEQKICNVLEKKYKLYPIEVLQDGEGPYGDTLFVVESR